MYMCSRHQVIYSRAAIGGWPRRTSTPLQGSVVLTVDKEGASWYFNLQQKGTANHSEIRFAAAAAAAVVAAVAAAVAAASDADGGGVAAVGCCCCCAAVRNQRLHCLALQYQKVAKHPCMWQMGLRCSFGLSVCS